jgi:drug/metabolite transporter (DMT)-like permease
MAAFMGEKISLRSILGVLVALAGIGLLFTAR